MLFRNRRLLVVSALASVAVAGLVSTLSYGQETPPREGRPARARPGGQEAGGRGQREGGPRGAATIEAAMKQVNRSLEQLTGQISDPAKRDENLALIGAAQRFVVSAKMLPLPPAILDKAADDAAKKLLQDDFRTDLIAVVRLMLDVEEDIAAGKGDAANAKLDTLQKKRDAAHKKLGVE